MSSVAPPAQCSVRLGKNTAQLGTKETEDKNMAERQRTKHLKIVTAKVLTLVEVLETMIERKI